MWKCLVNPYHTGPFLETYELEYEVDQHGTIINEGGKELIATTCMQEEGCCEEEAVWVTGNGKTETEIPQSE